MEKVINIAQQLNSSTVITRESAREIFTYLKTLPESEIILDFANVAFASRSFFDELYSLKIEAKSLKTIEFINLNRDLQALLDLITRKEPADNRSYLDLSRVKTRTI
jgi:hypothetical protein